MKWLQAIPGTRRFSTFSNAEFSTIVKWHLGVKQYPAEFRCDCGDRMDVFGDHAVMCKGGGDRIVRHNRLRDRCFDVCRDVGLEPIKEKRFGKDKVRPGDVFLPSFRGGKDVYVDWCVVHPVQSSYCQAASLEEARTALEYEDKKFKKYEPWFRDSGDVAELAPVAVETFGSYGKSAKVLWEIRRKAQTRGIQKDLWATMFSDFSVILVTHIARSILSRLVTFRRRFGYDEEVRVPSEEEEDSFGSWGE
eukprot:TRINITY_DN6666_c0_g1_i2.p1 TRINITY_DN6666_c0_g1~~TRINITY_DN6666_c0_g1_i2.p1  ORF type:complete len:249 (-),score=-1.48 TRINITY_DN6666_c0_g1_i2:82-828(-)